MSEVYHACASILGRHTSLSRAGSHDPWRLRLFDRTVVSVAEIDEASYSVHKYWLLDFNVILLHIKHKY